MRTGGVRPIVDGAGVANSGVGVRGYMTVLNFGTNFSANPYSLNARNNLVSDLMGTTGNYLGLGSGPASYTGAPAYQSGTNYTAVFAVARTAVNSVTYSVTITGEELIGRTIESILHMHILALMPSPSVHQTL